MNLLDCSVEMEIVSDLLATFGFWSRPRNVVFNSEILSNTIALPVSQ